MIYDIRELASNSFQNSHNLDHLINNNNSLVMTHDVNDRLTFTYIDNSKPYNYLKLDIIDDNNANSNAKSTNAIFEDKYKRISWDYPYIITQEHTKLVAKSWDIFKVFEYDVITIPESKRPDFYEVEKLILNVIKRINNDNFE